MIKKSGFGSWLLHRHVFSPYSVFCPLATERFPRKAKRHLREADHTPPPSAEVKGHRSITLLPPPYDFLSGYLVEHLHFTCVSYSVEPLLLLCAGLI
jgi:hypothetical protein